MVVDCQRARATLSAGLLALLVVAGAGCGEEEVHPCDSEDPPPECNQCPRPLGIMPDDTLVVGDSQRVNVTDFFEDADSNDILIYTAESSDESKVTVEMDGAVLTYIGVDAGESDITVNATDKEDCAAKQEFEVTVMYPNRPPICEFFPPTDIWPIGTTGEKDVPCSDPDGDDMTFTLESSDPDVFSVTLRGNKFDFEAVSLGTATVTATATDTEGNTGDADWGITVVEEEDN